MDRWDIYGKVHSISGYLPMGWVEYHHQEVPICFRGYVFHPCAQCVVHGQHMPVLHPAQTGYTTFSTASAEVQPEGNGP